MLKAPTVVQKPAPNGTASRPAAPSIPFTRASRKKSQLSFVAGPITLGTAQVPIGPIEVPAAGFLRYIELQVTCTAAGNSAAVAFNADGPFNAIAFLSVTNAAGDTIIVPITGYQLFLMNKYGLLAEDAPWCDPRTDPNFSRVIGTGATGGSFTFSLRIPFEVDSHDAFCAVPNLASNKSYQVQLMFAPLATIYSVSPTVAPTVSVTATAYFWTQPNPVNGVGVSQEVAPGGVGSVSMWRLQTAPVTAGGPIIQLTNTGNVLRTVIFSLRTAAGARTSADLPAVNQLILNNDTLNYLPLAVWQSDMADSFGYVVPGFDVVTGQSLDTGVLVYHYLMEQSGRVRSDSPRDQWLPTLDATLLQLRGTSFGASAATLEVLTNEIKPVSAAALYNVR